MKFIKLSLAAAVLATGMFAAETSEVGVSANMAMTSNYVWRGMTQTGNSPAIQGGVNLDFKGAYTGIWASSFEGSDASAEFDIYLGYANEISGFSYDVGYTQFMYPNDTEASNFGEAHVKLGYDFKVVSIGAAYFLGVDTNDAAVADENWEPGDGWEVSASVPLPMDVSIDATYGSYDDAGTENNPTNNFGDYYLVSVAKSFGKFDFTLAYTGMNYEDTANEDEDNFIVTVGTEF